MGRIRNNTMGDASLIPSLPYNSVDFDKPEEWLYQLKTEGFTIIKSVANAEEVENAKNLLWKWLEDQGTGILRNDPSTWTDEAWPEWPGYKKYGSCKKEGAAHQDAAWYLRGLPNLKFVFASIYNTDDLIVSYDGIILWRSWKDDELRRPSSSRLHVDQNPAFRPGFQCVQGMLPMYPVTPGVGGTVLVPRSHLQQENLLKLYPHWAKVEKDYCVLDKGIRKDPLQNQAVLIPLEPGDLLLWDSRLVHAGSVGACSDPSELARGSLCVCMGPRERASQEVLQKRREALDEGWGFSHWPWEARGNMGAVSEPNKARYHHPNLTEEQWELV